MTSKPTPLHRSGFVAAFLALAPLLTPEVTAQEVKTPEVQFDGELAEWPANVDAIADGEYAYLRLRFDEEFTLQGGTVTTRLAFDLDGKATTGRAEGKKDPLGVDLEVVFSPPSNRPKGGLGNGITVSTVDDLGLTTLVGHAPIGLKFAPSFAAKEYELRIARNSLLGEPVGSRWRASSRLRALLTVTDAAGKSRQAPIDFDLALPPRTDRAWADQPIPSAPKGTLRVMSWNVEWENPEKNPAPFSRILTTLQPDVLMLQEWKATPEGLAAWFSVHCPSTTPWRAHTFDDLGVSVVSRYPLVPLNKERLMPARSVNGKKPRAIRLVAAEIDTPIGKLIAASTHLKCCGAMGTWEDELRQVEASSINEFLHKEVNRAPDSICLISGDMNLVGTRLPVDILRDGLDADSSPLDIIDARLLGGNANYTWNLDDSRFTPGRLDFALFSDSIATPRQAFILDTESLSDDVLKRNGLRRDDSKASDHRPVVWDLAPTNEPSKQ